jgi:8-amino-7-oxononanoate synthase
VTAPPPVDLTSSLFLGRTHPSCSLPGWSALTTGRPAVLGESPVADELARHVAAAQGAASGIVARSTLHALVDLVEVLLRPGDVLALDERVYPLTRWAADLAAGRGVHVTSYPHHRPGPVAAGRGRVWWATDGWCPGCNRPAPLKRLAALASATGAGVVVDDTLAFGVLGRRGLTAFGDGTGTPRWCGVPHDTLVWLASLAKAHGAPLTLLTGPADVVMAVRRHGGSRAHASPPTSADLAAAHRSVLDQAGNASRRAVLAGHVHRMRRQLRRAGTAPVGLPFPLVAVPAPDGAARYCHRAAAAAGVRTLPLAPRCGGPAALGVLLRADLTAADVDRAADVLSAVAARHREASRDRQTPLTHPAPAPSAPHPAKEF